MSIARGGETTIVLGALLAEAAELGTACSSFGMPCSAQVVDTVKVRVIVWAVLVAKETYLLVLTPREVLLRKCRPEQTGNPGCLISAHSVSTSTRKHHLLRPERAYIPELSPTYEVRVVDLALRIHVLSWADYHVLCWCYIHQRRLARVGVR